ncbi:TetR/AcrR family transcriptional regulator [Streptomyces sp. NPDC021212]|uniref:TetR/AcrR family transcriptional regulator n=1 Tax=Streptomyces sp. NPDC021212 TaxID=3365118 RepID=UPI0037AE6188
MPTEASRPLRADAARNFEKIVRAAREVYAERGPDAHLEEVARRAGVGIATLFRRFPDKGVLLRAVLDQQFAERVVPAVGRALEDEDPRHGLAVVMEAALSSAVSDYNVLTAARNAGVLAAEVGDRFFDALDPLVRRGQRAGVIRDDLVPEDVRRIMVMLMSVLWTMEPGESGWRRYVTLVLDGLSPTAASTLSHPAPAIRHREG